MSSHMMLVNTIDQLIVGVVPVDHNTQPGFAKLPLPTNTTIEDFLFGIKTVDQYQILANGVDGKWMVIERGDEHNYSTSMPDVITSAPIVLMQEFDTEDVIVHLSTSSIDPNGTEISFKLNRHSETQFKTTMDLLFSLANTPIHVYVIPKNDPSTLLATIAVSALDLLRDIQPSVHISHPPQSISLIVEQQLISMGTIYAI